MAMFTNFNVVLPGMHVSQMPGYTSRPNAYMSALRNQITQHGHAESLARHGDYDQQQGRDFVVRAAKLAVNDAEPAKGRTIDDWA
ncbi:MAG: hypothetical protein OEZ43_05195 [Gammaproteobacteria bacterium]|nr:hypothetical protein [Gammaproteobacteria bacterium]